MKKKGGKDGKGKRLDGLEVPYARMDQLPDMAIAIARECVMLAKLRADQGDGTLETRILEAMERERLKGGPGGPQGGKVKKKGGKDGKGKRLDGLE